MQLFYSSISLKSLWILTSWLTTYVWSYLATAMVLLKLATILSCSYKVYMAIMLLWHNQCQKLLVPICFSDCHSPLYLLWLLFEDGNSSVVNEIYLPFVPSVVAIWGWQLFSGEWNLLEEICTVQNITQYSCLLLCCFLYLQAVENEFGKNTIHYPQPLHFAPGKDKLSLNLRKEENFCNGWKITPVSSEVCTDGII